MNRNPIRTPSFFSPSTNWRTQKLLTLNEYLVAIDKNKPDFLVELRTKDKIRAEVQTYDQMNEEETVLYLKEVKAWCEREYSTSEDVRDVLMRNLDYKKPQLINADCIDALDDGPLDKKSQIYVIAQFARPGR